MRRTSLRRPRSRPEFCQFRDSPDDLIQAGGFARDPRSPNLCSAICGSGKFIHRRLQRMQTDLRGIGIVDGTVWGKGPGTVLAEGHKYATMSSAPIKNPTVIASLSPPPKLCDRSGASADQYGDRQLKSHQH